jgi:hypothetical protein
MAHVFVEHLDRVIDSGRSDHLALPEGVYMSAKQFFDSATPLTSLDTYKVAINVLVETNPGKRRDAQWINAQIAEFSALVSSLVATPTCPMDRLWSEWERTRLPLLRRFMWALAAAGERDSQRARFDVEDDE